MSDTTVLLKDYQPPVFEVEHIHLSFDLQNDHTLVESHMALKRLSPGNLCLNGDELKLISIHMNGELLQDNRYQRQGEDLLINDCPDAFELTIVTQIHPDTNTALSGLFRSNQQLCTQCEAEGFRRMTFFPDRPDVLTRFTTKIIADKDKYPVLLSNGNLIESGDLGNGRHWVVWQDPFKKPSYLFALVAGNLVSVKDTYTTCSGKKVDLIIYVEPGNEDKCDHAMQSLHKAMRWDEEVYGREYDLSIFMIVAVSDFNMGAMENKGLNIFNAKYILARPETATDEDFAHIESVVGHEYFHNWTGNRVTCRDWFQLSLKEGLTVFRDQEFSRDMNSRDVNRILDVDVLRNAQFPEDASSMAHPVRPESYQEINNFYTATIYNKGAEVIRMQHTLLGAEGFRRGMDLYFERHDGQAVTINDFIAAMEDANGVDFTQFKRWYCQAGTPLVDVETVYKDNTLTLILSQSCPPTAECQDKKPFHIPIRLALFDTQGKAMPLEKEVLELRQAREVFTFSNLASKPIVSLLRDFSAPIKLNQSLSKDERLALLRFETNGYAKWNAAQQLAIDCITNCYHTKSDTWQLPKDLSQAFADILGDKNLDASLKASLLTPPAFEDLIADLSLVDVNNIIAARDFYRISLGKSLYSLLKLLYLELWHAEENGRHGQAYANRRLRNSCLQLMMYTEAEDAVALCKDQFARAGNMTDQLASFKALANLPTNGDSAAVIDNFYQQWSTNDLVLDKWFAIQASSELPDTLTKVKSLLQHPAFSLKNPNKVRSLIGAFAYANPRRFHAIDGSGYRFLTDMLIELDKINAQVAARLSTPFTRWRCFDKVRQTLIHNQLLRLSNLELSRDLKEVVFKSL